jgi:hypothetical protein
MNAKKKTLIIIIIIFILSLIGLFFAYQSFVGDKYNDGIGIITDRDGINTPFPNSPQQNVDENGNIKENGPVPTLRQVSDTPTSGGVVFNTDGDIKIRYVERSTGHIFETTSNSLNQVRISNTTIPRIQKSFWSPDGEMVILQYVDENEILKSFYGEIIEESGVIEGWFLSNNISDIDVHEDGDIFYIQRIGDSSKGFISNFDGTNSRSVLSSSIYDWNPQLTGSLASITTKPSNGIVGFLYLLRPYGYEKIISDEGLIASINPEGTKILFSISNTDETNLFVYDMDTKNVSTVPFRTLAEKCVWSDNSSFLCASPYNVIQNVVPDDWYKGLFSFSDDIWSYNIETETSHLVFDAEESDNVFDAINLSIDTDGKILLFTNKNDLTLWSLSL